MIPMCSMGVCAPFAPLNDLYVFFWVFGLEELGCRPRRLCY